jgi:hypothetical protein
MRHSDKSVHSNDLSTFCLYLHNLLYKYCNNNNNVVCSNLYILMQSVHFKIQTLQYL